MTPERIAALRDLCDEATPGPWFVPAYAARVERIPNPVEHPGYAEVVHFDGKGAKNYVNLHLAAEARTAIPEALNEIERLQKELRRICQNRFCDGCRRAQEINHSECRECVRNAYDLWEPIPEPQEEDKK